MVRREFLTVAATAAAQTHGGMEIEGLEKSWVQAVLNRDVAGLDRMLAPDLIYAHASGVVDTKSSYIDKIKLGKQVYRTLEQRNMSVRLHGDAAVAHCWAHVTGVNPAGNFDDKVMMMHVWSKKPEGWKLVAHQTTKVEKLP